MWPPALCSATAAATAAAAAALGFRTHPHKKRSGPMTRCAGVPRTPNQGANRSYRLLPDAARKRCHNLILDSHRRSVHCRVHMVSV